FDQAWNELASPANPPSLLKALAKLVVALSARIKPEQAASALERALAAANNPYPGGPFLKEMASAVAANLLKRMTPDNSRAAIRANAKGRALAVLLTRLPPEEAATLASAAARQVLQEMAAIGFLQNEEHANALAALAPSLDPVGASTAVEQILATRTKTQNLS